jgi:hydroxyacylglutathione hydrolase
LARWSSITIPSTTATWCASGTCACALWTPGHTPEHLSYLLFETAEAAAAVAMFSGDALFAGEVGRPDLLGDEQTEALTHQLYETVSQRFAALPDDLIVYPGHTAGSSCGKKIGDASHTTIGAERIGNYAFQARDRETFVRQVLEDMPAPPT